jgi:HEAT repeat protein
MEEVIARKGFTMPFVVAYAQAAEHVSKNSPQRAAKMFATLGTGAPVDSRRSRISHIGQIHLGGPPAIDAAKRAINSGSPELTNAAIAARARSSDTELVSAAIALLPKLDADTQAIMIEAVASRREPSIKDAIKWALAHEKAEVRIAGLRATGKQGDADFVPELIKALESADEAKVAAASLTQIHGEKANAAVIDALPGTPPAVRMVLLRSLPPRRAVAAIPQILEQAKENDPGVAGAAMDTLAILGRASEIGPLVAIMGNAKDEGVRKSAEAALIAIGSRAPEKKSDPILAALAGAKSVETRCGLIRVLGGIADEKALDAVKEALRDGEPAVRDCALRTLAAWPNTAATPALLSAARLTDANNLRRAIAIRGALRQMAGEVANQATPNDQLVDWFARAESMVRGPEEKRLLVSGLANLRHGETMKMIARYLEDDEVRAEAAQAAVEIAKHQASSDQDAARKLLERVISTTSDAGVKKSAQEALSTMK